MTTTDEFTLHAGNRGRLRNRAIILVVIGAGAVAVFVNALQQAKGDSNGSVGALVIPAAVAVTCIGGVVLAFSQWWEDNTYLRIVDGRLAVRHGTAGGRGRITWYEREAPLTLTAEGVSASRSLFLTQGDARARLGNVDAHQLESWLRTNGFTLERR